MTSDKMREYVRKSLEASLERELMGSYFGGCTSSTSTASAPESGVLDWDKLVKAISTVDIPRVPEIKLISSSFAVEFDKENPTREETRVRTWKERLFSLPWQPWRKTKVVHVTNYKPAMYRVMDMLVYHPALESRIREMFK